MFLELRKGNYIMTSQELQDYLTEDAAVGERFYRQQAERGRKGLPTGSSTCSDPYATFPKGQATKAAAKAPRKLKADYVSEIGVAGIDKLTLVDLQVLAALVTDIKLVMPTGRLKSPYIDQCSLLCPEVKFDKLTIATLKLLIGKYS